MEDGSRESFLNALSKLASMDRDHLKNQLSKTSQEFCWEEQEKVMLAAYQQYLFK